MVPVVSLFLITRLMAPAQQLVLVKGQAEGLAEGPMAWQAPRRAAGKEIKMCVKCFNAEGPQGLGDMFSCFHPGLGRKEDVLGGRKIQVKFDIDPRRTVSVNQMFCKIIRP